MIVGEVPSVMRFLGLFHLFPLSIYQIADLEQDKRDLERQVNELKAKCEQIEKRAAELRQVEEKKHSEEQQFLKRTNAQLKVSNNTNG